jgi:hypothetical protein
MEIDVGCREGRRILETFFSQSFVVKCNAHDNEEVSTAGAIPSAWLVTSGVFLRGVRVHAPKQVFVFGIARKSSEGLQNICRSCDSCSNNLICRQ